jgi:DNA-binding GntR family transcriptional regulator
MNKRNSNQSQTRDLRMENRVPDSIISEIFPRKVKRSILREEVYEQLKKMILSGKIKKGQRLVEEKLARRLNVSRNPVQIAFRRLRKENLVIWKYRKGTFVT